METGRTPLRSSSMSLSESEPRRLILAETAHDYGDTVTCIWKSQDLSPKGAKGSI